MRQKEMLNKLGQINAQLAGDAAFVELGRAAAKVLTAPAKAQLPDEAKGLLCGLKGNAAALLGVVYVNENYDIPGLPAVEDALGAAFAADAVISLGDLIGKIVTRKAEVLGTIGSATPPALPAANTAKGNCKVVSSVFAGPPGKVDPRYAQTAANTAQGGENVVEVTEKVEGNPDLPNFETYWPTKPDELFKTSKNDYVCPNPMRAIGKGKAEHARHKDKFSPWNSKIVHGYRSDLDGVLICGGCRDELTALFHSEKKAAEKAEADEKKKLQVQAKIDAYTVEYDALVKKLDAYKAYEQEQIKAIAEAVKAKDEMANELGTDNLANIQRKIEEVSAKMQEITDKVVALEAELVPATVVNTPPVVVENKTVGNEQTGPKANGKTTALAQVKKNRHQKKGR